MGGTGTEQMGGEGAVGRQDAPGVQVRGVTKGARGGKDKFKRCEQRPGDKWVWRSCRVAGCWAWTVLGGQVGEAKCSQVP